jgi:hypothetical protein
LRVSRPIDVVVLNCCRHRDKGHALRIKDLDDLGEIGERAGQAIDLVGHHRIDLAGLDVGKELLQGRAVHRGAGEAAVIIVLRQTGPALMALAFDVSLAGLALGVQGVERLLQALLGGFAGIDGAAQRPPAVGRGGFIHGRRPPQRPVGQSSS